MSPPSSAASNAGTNQRLRGLLSRSTSGSDRTLPTLPGPPHDNTQTPPPPRSNTSTPVPDARTGETSRAPQMLNNFTNGTGSNPTVFRTLSPIPRSDRIRSPPPPPLPIDVEADVPPSPPLPEAPLGSGFRQIEIPSTPKPERETAAATRLPASGPERLRDANEGVHSKPLPSIRTPQDSVTSAVSSFEVTTEGHADKYPEPNAALPPEASSPSANNGSSDSSIPAPGIEFEEGEHSS